MYSNRTVEICKRLGEFEKKLKRLREFEKKHKRLRDFEEIEILRQSCRGDCEQQGGKLLELLAGFRPEFGLWGQ